MKSITTLQRVFAIGVITAVVAVAALGVSSTAHAQVVTTANLTFAERLAEIVRQIQVIQDLLNEQVAAESGDNETEVEVTDPAPEESDDTGDVAATAVEVDLTQEAAVESADGLAVVLGSAVNEDLQFLRDCFFTVDDVECEAADLSDDGVVNAIDLGLFRSAIEFDLSGDNVVDLSEGGTDVVFLQDCFLNEATEDCVNPDFNDDGVVNFLDLAAFRDAEQYDLNADGYVDLRDDSAAS